jgi:hypothetical protein
MDETTTIRDALESAFDSTPPEPSMQETPAIASSGDSSPPSSPAPQGAQEDPASKAPLTEGADGKPRDDKGKFKPKDAAAPEGIQAGPKAGPKPAPDATPAAPVADKAPVFLKPEAREHWASVPEAVKAEIVRREREVNQTLQESSEARKFADAVLKTVQPYEAFIKAENSNPLQAIDNLMATAARLRTAPAHDIANLVAGIVNQFGTGRFGNQFIDMLDGALAGQTAQQNPQDVALQSALQRELAPMKQMMTQWQQAQAAQQMQLQESAAGEVEQFLSSVEFGEDLRNDMADIMELAQRKGQSITLQEAYKRAAMMNPEVSKVLIARRKNQTAQQQNGVAQKAKVAASSVSGGPAMGAPQQTPNDIRSAIESAIALNSR